MKRKILIREMDGDIAILRLNRPAQANALNRDLFVALTCALDDLQWDDGVSVVIITGEGKKSFCAGIDLKERAQKERKDVLLEREKVIRPFYLTLGDFPKPAIAALNGYVVVYGEDEIIDTIGQGPKQIDSVKGRQQYPPGTRGLQGKPDEEQEETQIGQ